MRQAARGFREQRVSLGFMASRIPNGQTERICVATSNGTGDNCYVAQLAAFLPDVARAGSLNPQESTRLGILLL